MGVRRRPFLNGLIVKFLNDKKNNPDFRIVSIPFLEDKKI